MSRKVKVGIIGFGFMGTTHFDIYRKSGKAMVAAMADVDPAKRAGDIRMVFANIGGNDNSKPVDLSGVQVYADGMDLINDPNVELVDICVPVYLHKKYALAAIAAGKQVFCEKPLSRTSEDAQEIAVAAEKAGTAFMVGMCIRFWPEYKHALDVIKSGRAGKIITATFKRVSPDMNGIGWQNWFMKQELSGGALLDLHLHDVDFIRQLIGMPQKISAYGTTVHSDGAIDHVMACYDYGDGTLVTAEGGWGPAKGTPFEMSFQIVCKKMTLRFAAADGYSLIHEDGTIEKPVTATEGKPTGWHVEIDYLLDCLLAGKKPDMPLDGVVDALEMVEAELKSIQTGAPVAI